MKNITTLFFATISFVFLTSMIWYNSLAKKTNTLAQDNGKIKIMLMGTYHFNNPAADEYNSTADDYLSEKRQRELRHVNNLLREFNPDKVFLECFSDEQAWYDSLYQLGAAFDPSVLKNNFGRNEIFQIGFKLAQQLDHESIQCVDARGFWFGSSANTIAKKHQPSSYAKHNEMMENRIKTSNGFIKSHPIIDHLILENEPDKILAGHQPYISYRANVIDPEAKEKRIGSMQEDDEIGQYFSIGVDNKYIGAELVAEWYKRNIIIFAKVIEQLDPKDKRLFLLFGSGHIRILRHLFKDHPDFEIVEVSEYLHT